MLYWLFLEQNRTEVMTLKAKTRLSFIIDPSNVFKFSLAMVAKTEKEII